MNQSDITTFHFAGWHEKPKIVEKMIEDEKFLNKILEIKDDEGRSGLEYVEFYFESPIVKVIYRRIKRKFPSILTANKKRRLNSKKPEFLKEVNARIQC